MEAIILAGGFGTRLRPFTYTRAKSLLPILNKPMISYIMKSLPKEVDKVILAVNFQKNQIERYFEEKDFGKTIVINNESTPLGTGGATKFAEKHITGRFFVLNSDTICSLNLDDMIQFHKKNNAFSTISLWPVENVSEFGVVDVKDDGNIVRFVEKPKPEDAPSNFINAGAYLFEPEVLDYIRAGRLVSMEKEIFPQIINETKRFFGYKFQGYWTDVGRIKSYIDANKFFLEKQQLNYLAGVDCEINGRLHLSCIGNNVTVKENAQLESTIVFDNASIGKNVILKNCVIGENCIIGDYSSMKNTAVGDNEKLDKKTIFDNIIIWNQAIPAGYPKKQIGNVIGE